MKKYKNLIFDLHGVLVSKRDIPISLFDDKCIEIIQKAFNCSHEEAESKYNDSLNSGLSHGQAMKALGVYGEYLKEFNLASKENGLIAHSENPRLVELLNLLAERIKLYVWTNNPRTYAINIIKALGINPDIFEKIVTLEDIENPKPSTDGLRLIVNGGRKSDYCYFGDRMDVDIEPARKFGIDSILVEENFIEKIGELFGYNKD